MAQTALGLDRVAKAYGAHLAVDNVELEIPAGELHALIGPNGAGKSTLLGLITGEHRPTAGRVTLEGRDISRVPAHRRVRSGIGAAFQVSRVFASLTVGENALSAVLCRDRSTWTFWRTVQSEARRDATGVLSRVGLEGRAGQIASTLAQGDRKRLELAMALALGTRVLLLDEPTAGMSPEETLATVELIESLWRSEGLTVIITEHDMDVVFRLAQRITVLDRGRVICTGDPADVREREDVRAIYFGQAAP